MNTRTCGVSNPTFRPAIVILVVAYAIFLLIIFLRAESYTWAILVIPTLPLLPLAYVLHRGSLAWLQIKDEGIEVIPSWSSRKFWSEQTEPPDSILVLSFFFAGGLSMAPSDTRMRPCSRRQGVNQDHASFTWPFGSWDDPIYVFSRHPGFATSRGRAGRGSFVLRCSQVWRPCENRIRS